MEIRADFLEWLGPDASINVLMRLNDPADMVRFSAVSRSWRRYVIFNGFCKRLCLRRCSDISCFTHVIVESAANEAVEEVDSSGDTEWANLVKEHKVYSYLSRCLLKPIDDDEELIGEAIRASSTDNDPFEHIAKTLVPGDRLDRRPSYWSSKGQSDPRVPETLIYRLGSRLCLVNEIKVQPFEAFFQPGKPIYSAQAVRFRMGHSLVDPEESMPYNPLSSKKLGTNTLLYDTDGEFVWTYVSPEFPMAQRNELQTFKLPNPVLCIGGFVQIELLGRIQTQASDKLYYICICHVEVMGRSISPAFDVVIDGDSGRSALKYVPDQQSVYESLPYMISHNMQERVTYIQQAIVENDEMLLMAENHVIFDDEEDVELLWN